MLTLLDKNNIEKTGIYKILNSNTGEYYKSCKDW